MKVLLAHPGAGPFVAQTVLGLEAAGLLERFLTALVLSDRAWSTRWLKRLPFGVGRALSRRVLNDLPSERLRLRPLGEVKRALAHRLDSSGLWADRLWDRNLRDFSAWAGRQISPNTRLVYGYDYGALELFEAAAKRGLERVLEQPAAAHEFNEALLTREAAAFAPLRTPHRRNAQQQRAVRSLRRDQELALATRVICNSHFTRNSFAALGVDVSRFHVVPLAAPPIAEELVALERRRDSPLRVLYAGNFSALKGAHYLIAALRQLQRTNALEVHCYGAIQLPASMLTDLPSSLVFKGAVSHAALSLAMHDADVLLTPSLSDGFGMVVTEALAAALPVIVTRHVGAADLIGEGQQGYLIEPGSARAIKDALIRCLDQRDALIEMRAHALGKARSWQWSDYRRAHAELIGRFLTP